MSMFKLFKISKTASVDDTEIAWMSCFPKTVTKRKRNIYTSSGKTKCSHSDKIIIFYF